MLFKKEDSCIYEKLVTVVVVQDTVFKLITYLKELDNFKWSV